jgi:hypothetical protein
MRRILLLVTVAAMMAAMVAASATPAFAGVIKGPDGRPIVSGNLNNPSILATHVFHNVPACEPSVLVATKHGPRGCGTGG